MTQEALKLALEALENNKQDHRCCEDTWYSCPKHEEGCANEAEGDECNCGADEVNAQFDNAITAIKEALAQPDPYKQGYADAMNWKVQNHLEHLPTAQPEQEPDWKGLVLAHNEECESRCDKDRCGYARYFENNGRRCPTCPVYEKIDIDITPPQRKPLTQQDLAHLWMQTNDYYKFAKAIEAAHGIKEKNT